MFLHFFTALYTQLSGYTKEMLRRPSLDVDLSVTRHKDARRATRPETCIGLSRDHDEPGNSTFVEKESSYIIIQKQSDHGMKMSIITL